MDYKTFDDWQKIGFQVQRGERSHKRNDKGKALFSEDQVASFDDEEERCKDAAFGFDGW